MVRLYDAVARLDALSHALARALRTNGRLECARLLLHPAERDVGALPVIRRSAEVLGLDAHQIAEKSIKAWLALIGQAYPLTHHLEPLMDLFPENGVALRFGKPISYTLYAVDFRCDGVESATDPIDRKGALIRIPTLLAHVRRQSAKTQGSP